MTLQKLKNDLLSNFLPNHILNFVTGYNFLTGGELGQGNFTFAGLDSSKAS